MITAVSVPDGGPEREALKAQRRLARGRLAARWGEHMQDRALEWFSAGTMLWWSFALALPGSLLSQPNFAAFHEFGITEGMWCWIFGIVGGGRAAALYINGRWPKGPYVRMVGALFGAVTWAQISVMLTQGSVAAYHQLSTGTGVYTLLSLADLFAIYRATRDARYYAR